MWRRFTGAAPARLALATALCLSTGAVRADDVDITTSTDDGFVLDNFSGTTATVQTGVTVSNTTFNFNCPFPPPPNAKALAAICASTKAWTLTNEGTIGPADFGDAVIFTAGGSVINFGSIDAGTNGISIAGGTSGTVDNKLGATVHGTYGAINIGTFDSPISGMVTNAGMITSDNQGVGIVGSGTVINLATGSIISHSGSNAVTMVLGTTNIVTNSGLIQSNDAQYGTAVSLDPGTVTNNPGGQILGALTGVWAHGGGSTTVINDGLIDASMADFAFGVPGSAIELDGGGNVTNTGTLQSSSTNSTDAAVYSAGAATVTNSGTIQSLTGGLAIQFGGSARHTLNLDTGSVLGGNVQGGTGTDNLVLMGTGTESIAKFLNFETLSMQGTDWALTGSATFSTSATVDDGLLRVNGDLTSTTVTVMADAVLGGGGTIHGDVGNSGTIAPGNSIGTLTVVGGVTFDTNSLFEVEIDPASGDELVVNGTATIDSSARVSVLAVPGTYADGAEYLILDATTRLGDFGGVIDNSAFLDFALDQTRDPDQVWLIITTVANFADVAETPNQFATAVAIQALDPGNPIFTAIANLDADTARDAFDSLSGEIHPSLRALLLDDSRFIRDAATDRIRRAFADLPPAPLDGSVVATHGGIADEPISLWGRAYGAFGDIEGDGNAATLDRTSGGFFLGGDRAAFDAWRFGFIAGYSHNEADVDARDFERLDRQRSCRALRRRALRCARPALRRRLCLARHRDEPQHRLPRLRGDGDRRLRCGDGTGVRRGRLRIRPRDGSDRAFPAGRPRRRDDRWIYREGRRRGALRRPRERRSLRDDAWAARERRHDGCRRPAPDRRRHARLAPRLRRHRARHDLRLRRRRRPAVRDRRRSGRPERRARRHRCRTPCQRQRAAAPWLFRRPGWRR